MHYRLLIEVCLRNQGTNGAEANAALYNHIINKFTNSFEMNTYSCTIDKCMHSCYCSTLEACISALYKSLTWMY